MHCPQQNALQVSLGSDQQSSSSRSVEENDSAFFDMDMDMGIADGENDYEPPQVTQTATAPQSAGDTLFENLFSTSSTAVDDVHSGQESSESEGRQYFPLTDGYVELEEQWLNSNAVALGIELTELTQFIDRIKSDQVRI